MRCSHLWLVISIGTIVSLLLGVYSAAWATEPWTPQQIAEEFARTHQILQPPVQLPASPRGRHTLDDIQYFTHYRMLCDFLAGLQYDISGVNFGGQREGESGSDYSIIQTDNTQEAIRVWSKYAIWTGDTASYGQYIRNAQGYCRRFPAWREETGGYYAAHNCGWGFEAARLYKEAYNDTTWDWYADSCAWWVTHNALAYNPNGTTLGEINPLAEGLAIGGLYPHAVYRARTDWITFALAQGRRIRTWFQSNPARLSNNETWALCGGTALWGLCESLFAAYPDSGQMWLATYGPQLDTWESLGQWNHSFCTWYCNAQNVVFEITHDSTYWNNAVSITDSLIGLDTDDDGGIPPGTGYPVTNDHSWVSAYMGWMGMERIINNGPMHDLAAAAIVSPNPALPHMAGDSLLVQIQVMNNGLNPESAWVRVIGLQYDDSVLITLQAGSDTVATLARRWVVPNNTGLPPTLPLHMTVTDALDNNPANDTLTAACDIRRGVTFSGQVSGETGEQIGPCTVEFYHSAYPDSVWSQTITDRSGFYTNGDRLLMAGVNTVRILPPIVQIPADTTMTLWADSTQHANFNLLNTHVVVIDDDGADTLEYYYRVSVDSLSNRVRIWNRTTDGDQSITGIPTTIWFTGNATQNTLDTTEQSELRNYLNSGGHLLLSGQNITDNLGSASQFLTTVLHCSTRTNGVSQRRIWGVANNPISNGVDMYIIGTGGAQNQTSPASIYALPGSTEILSYSSGNREVCGVSGFYGSGSYIFLSFGLEAVSGVSNTMTRTAFLNRCLTWLNDSTSSVPENPAVPVELSLEPAYPNPFNPSTMISFTAPSGVHPVRLSIYNLLGQNVATLFDGRGTGQRISVPWDGTTSEGLSAASGLYIYRLQAGNAVMVRQMQLVR
jgi:hypothetical protein